MNNIEDHLREPAGLKSLTNSKGGNFYTIIPSSEGCSPEYPKKRPSTGDPWRDTLAAGSKSLGGTNGQSAIAIGQGKNALDITGLFDGHPMSSINNRLAHIYPNPKVYKDRASYFGDTHQVYEELSNGVRSYHHRFQDPLAFENRHREVYTVAPNAFRRPKATGELRCSTADMYGNPLTQLPHLMRQRSRAQTPVTPQFQSQASPTLAPVVTTSATMQIAVDSELFAPSNFSSHGRHSPTTLDHLPQGQSISRSMSQGAVPQGQSIPRSISQGGNEFRSRDGLLQGGSNIIPMVSQSSGGSPIDLGLSNVKDNGIPGNPPRISKSQSLPRMKRPKWTRLSKTNVGFPAF